METQAQNIYTIDAENILKKYCEIFGISKEVMTSKLKSRNIIIPRQLCMVEMLNRRYTQYTVGAMFNRHHSTVTYAKKTVEKMVHTKNEEYLEHIQVVEDYNNRSQISEKMNRDKILKVKKKEILKKHTSYISTDEGGYRGCEPLIYPKGGLLAMQEYAEFYHLTNGTGILPEPKVCKSFE